MKNNQSIMKHTEGLILVDLKGNTRKDSLASEMIDDDELYSTIPVFDCSLHGNGSVNANEHPLIDGEGPFNCSPKRIESWEKYLDFYTDTGMVEYGLAEQIICYEESTNHVVKDICIDEGAPTHAKFYFGGSDISFHNYSDPSAVNDCSKDSSNVFDSDDASKDKFRLENSENPHPESFDDTDIAENAVTVKFVGDSYDEFSDNDRSGIENDSIQNSGTDTVSVSPSFVSSAADASNDARKDILPRSSPVSAGKLHKSSPASTLIYNSRVESGSITFSFGSSDFAVSSKEGYQNGDSGYLDTSMSKLEDGIYCGIVVSDHDRNIHGESSFSKVSCSGMTTHVEPVSCCPPQIGDSGHLQTLNNSIFSAPSTSSAYISYSGRIAYSGHVSRRSDSSTTSNRSFTFPVLQPEWNSSPVRMAKAERGYFHKYRRWRQGLFCCRF